MILRRCFFIFWVVVFRIKYNEVLLYYEEVLVCNKELLLYKDKVLVCNVKVLVCDVEVLLCKLMLKYYYYLYKVVEVLCIKILKFYE